MRTTRRDVRCSGHVIGGADASRMALLEVAPSHLDPQTTPLAVFRYDLVAGERFGSHDHAQHQLSWSPEGALIAETPGAQWTLPASLALWIPGGVSHDVGARRSATLHNLKFNARFCPQLWDEPTAVAATPLVIELIRRLADPTLSAPRRARAEGVLIDELRPASVAPMSIPLPSDPRALAVARALIDDPADDRPLCRWGAQVGAGERTLVRFFSEQTGLTFTAWRAHVRVRAALALLDEGDTVAIAAASVGYLNVGAFIDAFRRIVGTTPGAYRAGRTAAAVQ